MENATKALLIAGAVLIAIVLIGLGVLLVNQTSGVKEQTQAVSETMAVQIFNKQFTQYLGQNQNAGQIKALLNAIRTSNAKNENHIDVEGIFSDLDLSKVEEKVFYTAFATYNGEGKISAITISDGGTTPGTPVTPGTPGTTKKTTSSTSTSSTSTSSTSTSSTSTSSTSSSSTSTSSSRSSSSTSTSSSRSSSTSITST